MYREIRNTSSKNGIEEIFGTQEERLSMSDNVKNELKSGSIFIEVDNGGVAYIFSESNKEWSRVVGGSTPTLGVKPTLGLKMV